LRIGDQIWSVWKWCDGNDGKEIAMVEVKTQAERRDQRKDQQEQMP
jgi:hypothetical protein